MTDSWSGGAREMEHIQVRVNGDIAVLAGEVQFLWQKETAETVAGRSRVAQVRNEIPVAANRARFVRAGCGDDVLWHATAARRKPAHEHYRLFRPISRDVHGIPGYSPTSG
jgi:hypothetical protein